METGERAPWLNYLEGDVLFKDVEGVGRIYQIVIRVKPEGLQGIVKARGGGGYMVAFVGAANLQSLSAKIRKVVEGIDAKWKEDRYPPI